jgi:NADH:ubiquinone oxidoreductase subunit E
MQKVDEILDRHKDKPGPLMPVLQDLQKELAWLSPEVLTRVAQRLDIHPSKVYGVASFYTLFATKPKGRHIVRICENAPCHVLGAPAVMREVERAAGAKMGETTQDGAFTLEFTSCLGVCGVGPVMEIDGEVFGNLTPAQVPAILGRFREMAAPKEGVAR